MPVQNWTGFDQEYFVYWVGSTNRQNKDKLGKPTLLPAIQHGKDNSKTSDSEWNHVCDVLNLLGPTKKRKNKALNLMPPSLVHGFHQLNAGFWNLLLVFEIKSSFLFFKQLMS